MLVLVSVSVRKCLVLVSVSISKCLVLVLVSVRNAANPRYVLRSVGV